MSALRLSVDEKHFENGAFRKRWRQDSDFPAKMTGDCCVFKFLRRRVNGKHLMRFQSETSVFKFLRRSVNGKHLMRFQSETSVFKFLRRSVNGALV